MIDARLPVIVGVGEINDRRSAGEEGLDSAELMVAAALAADRDAGGGWLARCDHVAIVPQISFRELDVPGILARSLGLDPACVSQAPVPNGDTPVRLVSDAANAIASGEASVCLAVGGEALRTAARRTEVGGGELFHGRGGVPDLRRRYGLVTPSDIYPLYENACRPAWGQTLIEGQAESALIWSHMSEVAAENDGAWLRTSRSPAEIVAQTTANRPIAFPYTKLMVANASVNQGAAAIVTSHTIARAAGVPENRLIHVGAAAAAHEDEAPLARARWDGSPAMTAVLERVMAVNGLGVDQLDYVELYSCFPCVPKMARRILGLAADRPLTVHGGLTFGGGPIANYMMHAVAAMVRALRAGGGNGLLFGNGGYCTHNHALILSARALPGVMLPQPYDCQAAADALRGVVPPIHEHEGPATIETYTVIYGRDSAPLYGVVIGRGPDGARVIARVPANDTATIAFLTAGVREPVGTAGHAMRVGELLQWRATPT